MRNFKTDFHALAGGIGGVLSVIQGDEKYIAIMVDRGLSRDEWILTLKDAKDLINALRRELGEGDGDV